MLFAAPLALALCPELPPIAQWLSPDAAVTLTPVESALAVDGDRLFGQSEQQVSIHSPSSGALLGSLVSPGLGLVQQDEFTSLAARDGLLLVGVDTSDYATPGAALLIDVATDTLLLEFDPAPNLPTYGFGAAVAMNATRVLVGDPGQASSLGPQSGAAYLFDRTTGALLHSLQPQAGDGLGGYGTAVALDDNYALVASPSAYATSAGACLVFDVHTGARLGELVPPLIAPGDRFGFSVAIENGLAVVGSIFNHGGAGSAHVFDVATQTQLFELADPDPSVVRAFGTSVDIDGDSVLVGTSYAFQTPASAHLFELSSAALVTSLSTTAPLSGPGQGLWPPQVILGQDHFALSAPVHSTGATLSGTISVVERSSGQLAHELASGDGAKWDDFGGGLAIDNGKALVSAPLDDDLGPNSGSVYLIDVNTGDVMQSLTQPLGGADLQFGSSLAISGDIGLVGMPRDQANTLGGTAALIDLTTGNLLFQLFATNTSGTERFGESVAIDGPICVVGAPQFGNGDKGNVYVFDVASGTLLRELLPTDPTAGAYFGASVAICGNTVLVGAPRKGGALLGQGAAYLFDAQTGDELRKLVAVAPLFNAFFGTSVALDGAIVAVGAPAWKPQYPPSSPGRVHVFDAPSGVERWVFSPADLLGSARFGVRVAVRETPAGARLIAAALNPHRTAYVFDLDSGAQLQKLVLGSDVYKNGFPPNVALDDTRAFASAPREGFVKVYDQPVPAVVDIYCPAKQSSFGCLTEICTSNLDAQPISGAGDYFITASQVRKQANGLLFGSIAGPAAIPLLGGTLCVQPPAKRGPLVFSGGSDAYPCGGSFATLVNDGQPLQSSALHGLDAGPGTAAWYQYWYRDPSFSQGLLGTALSNAVRVDFQ